MKNLILSVQHLLAMYAGAILVPIIVGTSLKFSPEEIAYLITVDIFMCGVNNMNISLLTKRFIKKNLSKIDL